MMIWVMVSSLHKNKVIVVGANPLRSRYGDVEKLQSPYNNNRYKLAQSAGRQLTYYLFVGKSKFIFVNDVIALQYLGEI